MAQLSLAESNVSKPGRMRSAFADRNLVLGLLMVAAIVPFTLGPVAYMFVESFDVANVANPYKFGLDGWADVFGNPRTWSAVVYSFVLAVRVPIAIVVAFVISWLLIRVEIPGRRFIEITLWFGFFLPAVPIVMGWILLLDAHYGLINALLEKLPFVTGPVFSVESIGGIIWVHLALTTVPIMVILLTPAFRQLDSAFEEAADVAGAGTWTALRRITIPLLVPAMLTAFVAALVRSLETFEVEQILGTPAGINVYATRIFTLVNWDPPLFPQAMALSTLFLAILIGLSLFYQRYLIHTGSRPTISGRGVRLHARPKSWWVYLASALVIGYTCFSVILPLIVLVLGSFTKLFGFFFLKDPWTTQHWLSVLGDPRFAQATINSIGLGLAVGIFSILVFALIAWVLVRTDIWGRGTLSMLVWLPWAIPGLVLGLTFLSLLLSVPLFAGLYGSILPLILVLVIKEMPIGVQLLRTSLNQISAELEEAAEVAGAGFLSRFKKVTLPLIAPTLVSVFLLVFASTIRDIGTIILLATPGMQTLSLMMFDFAGSGRFETASVLGVMIAVISLLMTLLAFRIGTRVGISH